MLTGEHSGADLKEMIEQIADGHVRAFGLAERGVRLNVAAPKIVAEGDRATTFSLIANELIVNAIKHAFPGGRGGAIDIRVESLGDGVVDLVVGDDGVGLSDGADASGGSGSALLQGLTRQLGGELYMENSPSGGVRARVRAPIAKPVEKRE